MLLLALVLIVCGDNRLLCISAIIFCNSAVDDWSMKSQKIVKKIPISYKQISKGQHVVLKSPVSSDKQSKPKNILFKII